MNQLYLGKMYNKFIRKLYSCSTLSFKSSEERFQYSGQSPVFIQCFEIRSLLMEIIQKMTVERVKFIIRKQGENMIDELFCEVKEY